MLAMVEKDVMVAQLWINFAKAVGEKDVGVDAIEKMYGEFGELIPNMQSYWPTHKSRIIELTRQLGEGAAASAEKANRTVINEQDIDDNQNTVMAACPCSEA